MANALNKIKGAVSLLSRGRVDVILKEVGREIASVETSYGFRRDLHRPFKARPASIPIELRLFEKRDIELLALGRAPRDSRKALLDRLTRTKTIEAGIPSLIYVAAAADGSPCFLQCVILPARNGRLNAYYKGYFPPLAQDEVLLEGAFIPEQYRGKGIMACAMSQVAQKSRALGARWATTYVEQSNLPSIRGCLRAGFHPYVRKKATWRRLRQEVSFARLNADEIAALEASWSQSRETCREQSNPESP